jgi:hypothetical protein
MITRVAAAWFLAYVTPLPIMSFHEPPDVPRPEGMAPSAADHPIDREMTPEVDRAVAKGLAALAADQGADGSFGQGPFGRNVAVTSLACLAFMADGNLPGRGAYGEVVSKGLEFILANCNESGLVATSNASNPMYGHGFATLFLGEVYGMTQRSSGFEDRSVARKFAAIALDQAVKVVVEPIGVSARGSRTKSGTFKSVGVFR